MEELEDYLAEAAQAGCPPDQINNFWKARIILQPKQLRAAAAARECDKEDGPTEIAYGGARGGGKSAWSVAQLVADDCVRLPGLKCLLLRNMQRAARESLEDLRGRLLTRIPHTFSAHRGLISMPNGSRLVTGHFAREKDIDAYLGIEYDVIAIEEATTVTKETFTNIRTCCRSSKNWRPRLYLTTNPGGRGHGWFRQRFIKPYTDGTQSETRFIPATVDDNVFTNPEYVKTLDALSGWRKRAWRHGDWDVAAGQYFSTYSERHHVMNEFDDKLAVEWFAAMDYGFTHYTVVYLGCRDGDGNYYIVDEHARRKWLVEMHSPAIHAMFGRHGINAEDLRSFVAGADIFAKTFKAISIASEYAKHGIRMKPANMDRKGGWARIVNLLGDPDAGHPPRLFIHRRCVRLMQQLEDAVHDENDPEDVEKVDCDEEGSGGDDGIDAARYLLGYRATTVQPQKFGGY